MNGLIYRIMSRSQSAKLHARLYGSTADRFRPADLDTKFRFECKMTGNCCRNRGLSSNYILGEYQVPRILKYCEQQSIIAKGVDKSRDVLMLDGMDPVGSRIMASSMRTRNSGMAYSGAHGEDCQFLCGNACAIHPVKPWLCKLAPVGCILGHEETGGVIALAIQNKPECGVCFDGPEWTVRSWLEAHSPIPEFNRMINDIRYREGWWRIGNGETLDTSRDGNVECSHQHGVDNQTTSVT